MIAKGTSKATKSPSVCHSTPIMMRVARSSAMQAPCTMPQGRKDGQHQHHRQRDQQIQNIHGQFPVALTRHALPPERARSSSVTPSKSRLAAKVSFPSREAREGEAAQPLRGCISIRTSPPLRWSPSLSRRTLRAQQACPCVSLQPVAGCAQGARHSSPPAANSVPFPGRPPRQA